MYGSISEQYLDTSDLDFDLSLDLDLDFDLSLNLDLGGQKFKTAITQLFLKLGG